MFGIKTKASVVTVATLVQDLTAKVDALRSLSVQKDLEASSIASDIGDLQALKETVENDSKRAVSIADKLASLLS